MLEGEREVFRRRIVLPKLAIRAASRLAWYLGLEVRRYQPPYQRRAEYICQHRITFVVDVGAHEGEYASSLRRNGYFDPIISFEPGRAAFEALRAAADTDKTWHTHRLAIGAHDGEAILHIGDDDGSSSLFHASQDLNMLSPLSIQHRDERVDIARLDTVLGPLDIGNSVLLKMDVQGAELEVLAGAVETLPQVSLVECELSVSRLYDNQPVLEDVVSAMRDRGFELVGLQPGFRDATSGAYLQFDGMFRRKSANPALH